MKQADNSGLRWGRIYSFDHRLGFGHRAVVIFDESRRKVSICHPPTATFIRIDRALLGKVEDVGRPRWRLLRRQLLDRVKALKDYEMRVPAAKAKELAARMKAETQRQ